MSLADLVRRNRIRVNKDLKSHRQRRNISPALYSADRVLTRALARFARGKMCDIGCGEMPYREFILQHAESYAGIDIEKRTPEVSFVTDIQDMSCIEPASFDSALCFDVLEHVPNPARALAEIHRILEPDGTLILGVPFLARLHEEPHDYYRYTEHGLRHLLEEAGFEVGEITATGGIFAFIGHQVSTATIGLFWHIPVLRWLMFYATKWFCVLPSVGLDRLLNTSRLLPLGYLCIAAAKAQLRGQPTTSGTCARPVESFSRSPHV